MTPFLGIMNPDILPGDPLDKCMKETLNKSVDTFDEVEVMHDFEIGPNRRPRVLVQTAAHVAGAVRFFQAGDVVDQTSLNDILSSKIYPGMMSGFNVSIIFTMIIVLVCIHPKFGGWFAIRGVIIFKQLRCPELKQSQCSLDLCQSDIVKLLKLYNDSWRDWRFRDIIKTDQRYSDLQMQYFETPPDQRESIIREICSSHHHQ